MPKTDAIKLAWAEGWATYFSITAQLEMGMRAFGIPNVGDTQYTDTEDNTLDIDLASDGNDSLGEDNETSVMRMLFDSANGNRRVGSASDIWNILVDRKPLSLSDAWQAIVTKLDGRAFGSLGFIASKHHVAPSPILPADGANGFNSPPTFTWERNGGGEAHRNNQFTLQLVNKERQILTEIGPLSDSPFQPNSDDWNRAPAADLVYWIVVGANSDSPATGPYLSMPHKITRALAPSVDK
jgi:hypothetical protein